MKATDIHQDSQQHVRAGAAQLPQLHEARNPGMALDMDWVMSARANTSAIERRAATLPGRRSVKKDYQAAWLLKAITLIDLTTLAGDDTPGRVRRLCAKARQPVRADLLDALGMGPITTGAVCVYHEMVATAKLYMRTLTVVDEAWLCELVPQFFLQTAEE